jgi:hypothetical protein
MAYRLCRQQYRRHNREGWALDQDLSYPRNIERNIRPLQTSKSNSEPGEQERTRGENTPFSWKAALTQPSQQQQQQQRGKPFTIGTCGNILQIQKPLSSHTFDLFGLL